MFDIVNPGTVLVIGGDMFVLLVPVYISLRRISRKLDQVTALVARHEQEIGRLNHRVFGIDIRAHHIDGEQEV